MASADETRKRKGKSGLEKFGYSVLSSLVAAVLIAHGMKFSKKGGVVAVSVGREGPALRMEVAFEPVDPGLGNPADLLDRYYIELEIA